VSEFDQMALTCEPCLRANETRDPAADSARSALGRHKPWLRCSRSAQRPTAGTSNATAPSCASAAVAAPAARPWSNGSAVA